jgi:hypothetical protein
MLFSVLIQSCWFHWITILSSIHRSHSIYQRDSSDNSAIFILKVKKSQITTMTWLLHHLSNHSRWILRWQNQMSHVTCHNWFNKWGKYWYLSWLLWRVVHFIYMYDQIKFNILPWSTPTHTMAVMQHEFVSFSNSFSWCDRAWIHINFPSSFCGGAMIAFLSKQVTHPETTPCIHGNTYSSINDLIYPRENCAVHKLP